MTVKMKVLRFAKKYKKETNRHIVIALILTTFLLVILPAISILEVPNDVTAQYKEKKFVGSFVGDIVLNRYYDLPVNSWKSDEITKYLKSYFENSDFITGNITGQITDNKIKLLKDSNYSNVSIDYKILGNKEILDSNGIISTGANSGSEINIVYQQVNGIRIATLGISEVNYVVNLEWIEQAKKNADMVIVHLIWNDRQDAKVDDIQNTISKAICDSGADIVVGHNTKDIEPIEIYNNKIILYGVGNLLMPENFATTNDSVLIQYIIGKDSTTKIIRVIPLNLSFGYPKPALSIFNIFTQKSIFNIMTSELPKGLNWEVKKGILDITLD